MSIAILPPNLPDLRRHHLLCDGRYLSDYAGQCPWLSEFAADSRLAAVAVWLAKQTSLYKLWAWDSPAQPEHGRLAPLLDALGFDVFRFWGLGANSIIASTVKRYEAPAYLVSSDKTVHAYVNEHIHALCHDDGWKALKPADIAYAWGVPSPIHILDLLAWLGDPAIGVSGIPGVSEVTARRFVSAYGYVFDLVSEYEDGNPLPPELAPFIPFWEKLHVNMMRVRPSPTLNLAHDSVTPRYDQVPKLLYELGVEAPIIAMAASLDRAESASLKAQGSCFQEI